MTKNSGSGNLIVSDGLGQAKIKIHLNPLDMWCVEDKSIKLYGLIAFLF